MKNKALVVISQSEYIRNYIKTTAFSVLKRDFDLYFLISKKVFLDNSLKKEIKNLNFYDYNSRIDRHSFNLFDINMYLNQHKSKSFSYRLSRYKYIKTKNILKVAILIFKDIITFKTTFIREYFKYERIKILSIPWVYKLYLSYFNSFFKINLSLEDKVIELKPNIIIFPTSASDPISIDICRVTKKYKIKSLFLVDNWDNLSSKTILFEKPNHIAVWSQQAFEHATDIQGFQPENISIIGNPRYAKYFIEREKKLKSKFNFNYILFIGTTLAYDESNCMVILDKIISKNKLDLKIVYRPHPWRQGRDSIIGLNLKNIIIDPQLINSYKMKDNSYNVQPDLNYYPSLLVNALFVVGGMSSMIIESLIFRKTYLALTHEETNNNITSPSIVFKSYTHFDGLEKLSCVRVCHRIEELEQKLLFLLSNTTHNNVKLIDEEVDYYFSYDKEKSYSVRLSDTVNSILYETKR